MCTLYMMTIMLIPLLVLRIYFQDQIYMVLAFYSWQTCCDEPSGKAGFDLSCLTFESGIFVHPVPNDGPQQQHGAGHHQPIYGREQQAVAIQLDQENSHGKVPHAVTLRI